MAGHPGDIPVTVRGHSSLGRSRSAGCLRLPAKISRPGPAAVGPPGSIAEKASRGKPHFQQGCKELGEYLELSRIRWTGVGVERASTLADCCLCLKVQQESLACQHIRNPMTLR